MGGREEESVEPCILAVTSQERKLLKAGYQLAYDGFLPYLCPCTGYSENKCIVSNNEMIELFVHVTCIDQNAVERNKDFG